MNKHTEIRQAVLTVAVLLLCGAMLTVTVGKLPLLQPAVAQREQRAVIVVDAGHGGMDGGAQAPDGTMEKTINLAIASPLASMLRLCGYEVHMTRQTDDSIHDADCTTAREKKVSDMQNRLEMFENADLNISIHQNKFGVAKYYGAQVFYSTNNPASEKLATVVRESLYGLLQPDNTRTIKPGNKDIYLLYKTTAPTILVECGFLSNPQEFRELCDRDYQKQLAFAVTCGVLQYDP
ncbi:MAG: N-acetylmuramoyl-L-alanine amidase [Acutalibacteraceae bacterium]